MLTERPIPGQSLRTPPKNAPYERPPETANPLEALNIHLDNLSEKGAMEDVINALELDVDIVSLVEAILRSAVMEGIHSIDISLMIAPHIHEFIKGELDAIGVEYDEGFLDTVGENRLKESRIGSRIVDSIDRKEKEEQSARLRQAIEGPAKKIVEEPKEVIEEPVQKPKKGLMERLPEEELV